MLVYTKSFKEHSRKNWEIAQSGVWFGVQICKHLW